MVERKLYKTKLCVLYQRGRCSRQYCNFAHGSAELRGSFNGSNRSVVFLQFVENVVFSSSDFCMNDTAKGHPNALSHFILQCAYSWRMWYFLMISPQKINGKGSLGFLGWELYTTDANILHVEGYRRQEYREGRDLRERLDRMRSPLNNSPGRGDPKARHSSRGDSPRSLGKRIDRNHRKRKHLDGHSDYSGRMSEGTEDQTNDKRQTSSDTKLRINEQLQLREIQSEIKILESDKLQLEMYLEDKVKEADTLTLKIHELEMQLSKEEEERKRFTTNIKKFIKAHNRHLQLQDELKRSHAQLQKLGEQLDLDAAAPGIEDDSRINTMSDDVTGGSSPMNGVQMNYSPRGKGMLGQLGKLEWKAFRQSGNHDQLINADVDAYNGRGPLAYEDKSRIGINQSADIASADKYKVSERGLTLPSTCIAAHAIDEDVDIVEVDDKLQGTGAASTGAETDYKGDDENVDVDGVDEETVEVDIV
ncbi:hypothetical protein DH2020_031393 [Rehmannia glutinosa]|uniref:C3H1-type domain-containing protein n=1 Tax=Rehmannia glutinosa TaxID=99300 RepID=A0ABR0VI38_REHGL